MWEALKPHEMSQVVFYTAERQSRQHSRIHRSLVGCKRKAGVCMWEALDDRF